VIKTIIFALIFIITGGVVFSEFGRKYRVLTAAVALIAGISFILLLREIHNWFSHPESIETGAVDSSPPKNGTTTSKVVFAKNAPHVPLIQVAYSKSRQGFRVVDGDGQIALWSRAGVQTIDMPPPAALTQRHLSGDGEVIIEISPHEGIIRTNRPQKQTPDRIIFPKLEPREHFSSLAISHSGDYVALGIHRRSETDGDEKDAKNLHKKYIGKLIIVPTSGKGKHCHEDVFHSTLIGSLKFSRNDRYLVSANWDGTAIVSTTACTHVASFYPTEYILKSAAISPDGDRVATGDYNHLRLWRVPRDTSGNIISASDCREIFYDHMNTYLVCITSDGFVKLFDAGESRHLGNLGSAMREAQSGAFSPDSAAVIIMSKSEGLRLWKVSSRTLIAELRFFTTSKEWVILSPEGKYCSSEGADRFLRIEFIERGRFWDSRDTRVLNDLDRTNMRIDCDKIWPSNS
jgi:WD40 repeat protein